MVSLNQRNMTVNCSFHSGIHARTHVLHVHVYSGTSLIGTPLGRKKLSD